MKRTLQVVLGDAQRPVGTLHQDQSGGREHAVFTYAPDWIAAPDGFPIEPGLPLVGGAQFHRKAAEGSVFHAIIADTEPDGWGRRVILRDHAKRRQVTRQLVEIVRMPSDTVRTSIIAFRSQKRSPRRPEPATHSAVSTS